MMRSPLLSELFSLRDTLDTFASQSSQRGSNDAAVAMPMPIDVFATDDHAVLIAAVPGMRPDDVDVTIQNDTISVSGTVRNIADTEDAKHATWYVSELGSGVFRRSVTLPFALDADRAQATFEHGILRIDVPKAETAKPKKIAISASNTQQVTSGQQPPAQELTSGSSNGHKPAQAAKEAELQSVH